MQVVNSRKFKISLERRAHWTAVVSGFLLTVPRQRRRFRIGVSHFGEQDEQLAPPTIAAAQSTVRKGVWGTLDHAGSITDLSDGLDFLTAAARNAMQHSVSITRLTPPRGSLRSWKTRACDHCVRCQILTNSDPGL